MEADLDTSPDASPEFLRPDWPAPACVRALQTTRTGGVSAPPYDSFNLGLHTGDDPEAVRKNRARLVAHLPNEPVWLEQTHSVDVLFLSGEAYSQPPRADAVICRVPGQVSVIMTADCLPVLFCDLGGSVIAAAHAGWRGLAAGILENTLNAMRTDPANILAWLGPAIGREAFEVGDEVRSAFLAANPEAEVCFFSTATRGKYLADLYALARQRLNAAGVTRIYGGNHSTFSEPERFFSYRRDGVTGRMASLIWLA
ncbi:MAG: peptidoglycan editing factor PgeF [Zoogloeaceae bacterium]|jgi:YfiH family protein|nr:peptidoglycan editing factor PgeF [Zoogloeaceae bacterium]